MKVFSMNEEIPPYRALGFSTGNYYYYSRGESSVVALQAGAHSKKNLYRLAPQAYWVKEYPTTKKGDFDENGAASALMSVCQEKGIFSIKRVRGRGVWMERGQPVIHYGDRVNIEGKDYKPHLTPGTLIYELGEPLGYTGLTADGKPLEPLKDNDGAQFQRLMQQLRWQTEDQFMWYTGWLVCALIGGALTWRPHIWLTGGAQSGKTTLAGIMTKILGGNCLYIKSVSTEAGIRQTLKADCLSVVMDEAEREDAASHQRLQSVLTLARQSSSDDDSKIVKGTPMGTALNYQIRSPFCLSSINSNLVQSADKGRFTNVELSSVKLAGDVYDAWKKEMDTLLTPEYIQGLYCRVFSMVGIISDNAKELARAIERKTGDRRLGDQYGALLAGYLSISDQIKITEETAKGIVQSIEFEVEKEKAQGINDQHRLLNKIMQHVMRVPKEKGYEDVTIGEMCQRVYKGVDINNECKIILGNAGIKIIDDTIAIANDNDNLAEILKHSQWPHNWQQTLSRLTFSSASKGAVYFSPGCRARAVILTISEVIFDDDEKTPLRLVT